MKILKFGGSSVANAENINKVIQIVMQSPKRRNDIVVVSALGGVTDDLIRLATLASKGESDYGLLFKNLCKKHNEVIKKLIKTKNQKQALEEAKKKYDELEKILQGIFLIKELSLRSLDTVMSFGEQLSAQIIGEAINSRGVACKFVDARNLIKTDDNFGSANVDALKTHKLISNYFKKSSMLSIMGGFIASNSSGIVTTLGRGGSDYSASLIGAALNAAVIEIWTDVDGVMTADPRKVEKAFPLAEISYEEAGELAHFGAKVIHPKTMKPARLKNIPILIKNTFNPQAIGTKIGKGKIGQAFASPIRITPKVSVGREWLRPCEQDFLIKGISSLSNVSLLRLQSNNGKNIGEITAQLFDALCRFDIEVLLTTQSSHEQALSIALSSKEAQRAKNIIERAFELELQTRQMLPVSIKENLSIVAIVGKQMKGVPGISGRLFNTLGNNKINIVAIAQGSSELNVSAVIGAEDETRALQVIHEAFFGAADETVSLFLVGTGLIGSTLLTQIKKQESQIRLRGLANSRFMLFDGQGISLESWEKLLPQGKSMNVQNFVAQMTELNLPRSVFVDCTASDDIASLYEKIISAGIAIVTPNKKANSGPFMRYQRLRNLTKKNHTPFLYQTNVGAGLPIIHSIQNLISSGDEILKIEGVLSGTLSYIFNTFSKSDKLFSQIVSDAQNKGYTEPDPRDDLGGMDVARKILILAREIGLKMEMGQVRIEQLLSKECLGANSVDKFFTALKKLDSSFEKRKRQAQKNNKTLRYIASLQKGGARISLQEIGQDHPFFHLEGNDNIVSITTKRYSATPLVIKGPGAGAEVTAGGVLAGVLSIFN